MLVGEILRGQRGLAEGRRRLRRGQRARAGRRAGGTSRRDARTRRVRDDAGGVPDDRDVADDHAAPSSRRSSASRLGDLLRRARAGNAVVITDARGSWASPWIQAVTRAGVMERVPESHVSADRAGPARRSRVGRQPHPDAHRQPRTRSWPRMARSARRSSPTWRPTHLSYPAAARSVSSRRHGAARRRHVPAGAARHRRRSASPRSRGSNRLRRDRR